MPVPPRHGWLSRGGTEPAVTTSVGSRCRTPSHGGRCVAPRRTAEPWGWEHHPAPGAWDAHPCSGGLMALAPTAPLISSRLFPSLLCTRHAPCEPFLRGIRTKGSWEYLSGTGEMGRVLGGPSCPRPVWHQCERRRRGHRAAAVLQWALLPWWCDRGHCNRGHCNPGHHCRGAAAVGIATVGIATIVLLQWALQLWALQ